MIQRKNGIALWRQIADAIRADITSGKYVKGEKLPAEISLAENFGVNRHTVRSAIAALVQEGVLVSEQGRGTFIANAKKLSYQIGQRTRFSQSLKEQANSISGKLIDTSTIAANAEIGSALNIPIGTPVIYINTLHYADSNPVSHSRAWFPAERFSNIAADYQSTSSITKALLAAGVEDYFRYSTIISARHADNDDRKNLNLTPGAIVITTRAINVDNDGRPIEYSNTCFAADRMEISMITYDK